MSETLSGRLRSRAKFLPYGELDRILMIQASEALHEQSTSLDGDAVIGWLEDHDISLLPWQKAKLATAMELEKLEGSTV